MKSAYGNRIPNDHIYVFHEEDVWDQNHLLQKSWIYYHKRTCNLQATTCKFCRDFDTGSVFRKIYLRVKLWQ